jgi:predicted  nucleic acid-binding Zn ribbon protein
MTTAELIKHLQQYPPETIVVQSTDPEGNSFSPTFRVEEVSYISETQHKGDLWTPNIDLLGLDINCWASEAAKVPRPADVVDAVCFWPSS